MRFASGLAVLSSLVLFVAALPGEAQDAPGSAPSGGQVSSEGRNIYEQICQACHLADARGSSGTGAKVPALAGNANLADARYMLEVVVKGRGGMPWFTDMLTPAQMASVVNYVRQHFNSYPDVVTESQVQAVIATRGTVEGSQ